MNQKLAKIGDPHSSPENWDAAQEIELPNLSQKSRAAGLVFLMNRKEGKKLSFMELMMLIQTEPDIQSDPLVFYLFQKDPTHDKLQTYLMARFLMPEVLESGPSMSAVMSLLHNT